MAQQLLKCKKQVLKLQTNMEEQSYKQNIKKKLL